MPPISKVILSAIIAWLFYAAVGHCKEHTSKGISQWDFGNDAQYYLYTREHPDNENSIPLNFSNLNNLKIGKGLIFLFHGWRESRFAEWVESVRNAFLKREDLNIIVVDYSSLSGFYPMAVLNSLFLATEINNFLLQIYEKLKFPPEDIQFIGHSLGGQIAGIVGQRFAEKSNASLGKVIALDAAGPLFGPSGFGINNKSAAVVVVVHTDDEVFGYPYKSGSVDFYFNPGEKVQPGCPPGLSSLRSLMDPDEGIIASICCSHDRSYKYYVEALQTGGFTAVECPSPSDYNAGKCNGNKKLALGDSITTENTGTYYLRTNSESPFSKG